MQHIPQPHRSKPVGAFGTHAVPRSALVPCDGLLGHRACPCAPPLLTPPPSHTAAALPQKYGRALVVLPYVSVANEKGAHLADVLAPMHATAKAFVGTSEEGQASQPLAPRRGAGGSAVGLLMPHALAVLCSLPLATPIPMRFRQCCAPINAPRRGETVAVCTIEKANAAINRLAQEGRLGELCCVVVDELHMVGDADRGIGLEMSLRWECSPLLCFRVCRRPSRVWRDGGAGRGIAPMAWQHGLSACPCPPPAASWCSRSTRSTFKSSECLPPVSAPRGGERAHAQLGRTWAELLLQPAPCKCSR